MEFDENVSDQKVSIEKVSSSLIYIHENIHEIGGQTKIWSLSELWELLIPCVHDGRERLFVGPRFPKFEGPDF